MRLGLNEFIADKEYRSNLMSFIDLIRYNYNIMNKIAKVDTHIYHTIQNNYTTVCKASYTRH